jgi:glutathione S-transferase
MALELYSWPHSSGSRVEWALEELGLDYRFIELDQRKKEQLSPAYLAIHPQGKVPALVDGGQRFFEAAAIIIHLAHKYAVEKNLWPASGRPERADALCWTIWSGTELGPYMMQYIYHGLDSPFSYAPKDRSAACAEFNKGQLDRCVGALESWLADRDHIAGPEFSLADLAVASALDFGAMCGIDITSYSRTAAWCKRCTSRPAHARVR